MFYTNSPSFCILKDTAAGYNDFDEDNADEHNAENYKYEIQDLTLHVTRIEPSAQLLRYNDNRMLREPAR